MAKIYYRRSNCVAPNKISEKPALIYRQSVGAGKNAFLKKGKIRSNNKFDFNILLLDFNLAMHNLTCRYAQINMSFDMQGQIFLSLDKYDIRDIIKKLGADAISALQKAGVGSSYDYMHKESGNPLDQEEIFNHDLNKTLDIDYLYKLSNNTTSAFNCVGNLIYNSSKNYFSEQSTPVDDAYKYIQNVFLL